MLLETPNKDNKTPLVYAVEIDDHMLISLLISLGANVNHQCAITKRTPLMIAVYNGHLQVANALLDKGADVTLKDCNGLNVLHYAVDSNDLDAVKFVLEQNVDINERDDGGCSSLLRAGNNGCVCGTGGLGDVVF